MNNEVQKLADDKTIVGKWRQLGNMTANYFSCRQLQGNANQMEQINLCMYIDGF